ncbi:putative Type IV secretion system protein B4 [Vibrio nigripulchritudo FTn2]|nr:putative Type IV secretion system protein B4 [Vibrio nigripulchritudo FTn2]
MVALNSIINTYGGLDDACLTHKGNVLGGLYLSGVEPNTLGEGEREGLTFLLRNLIQKLPAEVSLSQYYFHYSSPEIGFKKRAHKRAQFVSDRRSQFLNEERNLQQSKLFWIVEIFNESDTSEVGAELIALCFQAIFDADKRRRLKTVLSYRGETLIEQQNLLDMLDKLSETLESLELGISFRSHQNHVLSEHELFYLQKALVNLTPSYLESRKNAPKGHWDVLLANSDVRTVTIDGNQYLKIEGDNRVYARIASVRGCGIGEVPTAAWASELQPVLQRGNYLYFNRFIPYSSQEKHKIVKDKEGDLYRSQLKISDFVTGNADSELIRARIEGTPQLKETLDELNTIAGESDKSGEWVGFIVIFDEDIKEIKKTAKKLKAVLENSDFFLLWETVGLLDAYKTMLIGCPGKPGRKMLLNTSQAAALSLFFRSNEGIPSWYHGERKEESLYIFESDDGVPFHYTPFVGDKCLVIGVGPTRSGKTFLKQCIATHFMKLGGMYTAMDIDPGSEALASFFKEDAKLFRVDDIENTKGFNPFSMSKGSGDDAFVRHMMKLIRLMLEMNEAAELRELNREEQREIESAIAHTMVKEGALKSFSAMLARCSPSVTEKLSKFKRGGIYGNLFDNDTDAIGALDKPYSVYNTQGVKDSEELAKLVNTEIFFRAVRLFEDPKYRTLAKFLEVDECQYTLAIPGEAEFLIAKARTWFKYGGGMGLWTQSVKHYSSLPEWSTLRSAATTFIFMSDPELTAQEYIDAFPFLSQQDCEVIQTLVPKRQALIIQMDVGIKKVINLFVEPSQYVIATSRPHEATIRDQIFKEEKDVDVAIDKVIKRFESLR